MKYLEFRKAADRVSKAHNIPLEDVEFEVSMDPKEIPAEDGVRYFGDPHELLCSGVVTICAAGYQNTASAAPPLEDDLKTYGLFSTRLRVDFLDEMVSADELVGVTTDEDIAKAWARAEDHRYETIPLLSALPSGHDALPRARRSIPPLGSEKQLIPDMSDIGRNRSQ